MNKVRLQIQLVTPDTNLKIVLAEREFLDSLKSLKIISTWITEVTSDTLRTTGDYFTVVQDYESDFVDNFDPLGTVYNERCGY